MNLNFKIIKWLVILPIAIVSANSNTSLVIANQINKVLSMSGDNFFVYPYDIIDYSVSGSSLIEFNLNSKGEVENFQIIEKLFQQIMIKLYWYLQKNLLTL